MKLKQILGIYLAMLAVGFSVHAKAEANNSADEQLTYCYGVYHGTKSAEEYLRRDQLLYASEDYANILAQPAFLKGKKEGASLSAAQKTECYDKVYVFLDSLNSDNKNLIDSVPYCFAFLSKAREEDYVPVFCKKSCEIKSYDNCMNACVSDFSKNLKKDRVRKGKKDAQNVNPSQYVHCLQVLEDFL